MTERSKRGVNIMARAACDQYSTCRFWDNAISNHRLRSKRPITMFESQFVTYAQNGEDVLLWRALKHVQKGCYIDVGAQDPVVDSVTKAFYDRGWHGINIEPVPRWYERLAKQRPHDINLRLAASDRPGTLSLFEVEGTGLSTSDPKLAHRHEQEGRALHEHAVECATLDQVCADNHVETVHFLKVDCEGAEKPALEGIALDKVRPWIILVEATEPNSTKPTWQQWEHLLTGRGYRFVFFDGLNRYYLASEHGELSSAFDAPVNIFDSATRASDLDTQTQRDRLQEEVEGLKGAATIARLRFDLAATTDECGRLKNELAANIDECGRLKSELAASTDECGRLKNELTASTDEGERLRGQRAALQQQLISLQGDCESLRVRQAVVQREISAYRSESRILREQIMELRSSHSWRITAPLRGGSRIVRRGVYVTLRPFGHMARPLLRGLSKNRFARRFATGMLGRRSHITEQLRLFLFGAAPASTASAGIHDRSANHSRQTGPQADDASSSPPFDLDAVMERVRAEVERRRSARDPDTPAS